MSELGDHKSKLMIMMMGKKKPSDGDAEPDGDEPSLGGAGLQAAMDDFLAAVKGDDSAGMAEAFRHAMDVCDEPEEAPDSEE